MTSETTMAKNAATLLKAANEAGVPVGIDTGEPEGRGLNIYTCEKCRGHIVTRDVDQGVTPFSIACRARHGCGGWMQSSMYRVFDQTMRESHQWYRPPTIQVLTGGEHEHVKNGGLLLREAPHDHP